MVRDELAVRIGRAEALGVLPVALLGELRDARARLRGELAIGVLLEKALVALAGVGGLRGAPILLLAAAGRAAQRQKCDECNPSCAECDHGRHPGKTGYVL